jgi:hypothetical protein
MGRPGVTQRAHICCLLLSRLLAASLVPRESPVCKGPGQNQDGAEALWGDAAVSRRLRSALVSSVQSK